MLHHIEIHISDLAATRSFWRNLLKRVGDRQTGSWGDGFTLSNGKDGDLTFVQVPPRHADRAYHRCGVGLNHLAFRVESRAAVDALRAWCRKKKIPMLYDERYPFATGHRLLRVVPGGPGHDQSGVRGSSLKIARQKNVPILNTTNVRH